VSWPRRQGRHRLETWICWQASRAAQVTENLRALDVLGKLDEDVLNRIEQAFA
jgi:aryl-alcohol dehydrogenase-like predicted oxidoreductase